MFTDSIRDGLGVGVITFRDRFNVENAGVSSRSLEKSWDNGVDAQEDVRDG